MRHALESLSDRANPVLVREIRRTLRGSVPVLGFLAIQVALLAACHLLIPSADPAAIAASRKHLSYALVGVFFGAAWMAAPFYGFSGTWSEKRDGTYELLRLSPLGEGRAAFGRLQTAAFLLAFLGSAMAPFACFLYLLGGIDVVSIALSMLAGIVLSAVLFLAGVAWSHIPDGPIVYAAAAALFLAGVALVAYHAGWVLSEFFGKGDAILATSLAGGTAIVGLGAVLARRHGRQLAADERIRPRRPVLVEGLWSIDLEKLKKTFGRVVALDRVSLRLRPGEIAGLAGANGAGKTTLLRVLATLETPDWGNAWFGADSLVGDPDRIRSRLGFVPDSSGFYTNQTVAEYLDFFARAHGLAGEARRLRVEEVLSFTGLDVLRDRATTALSKGMRQRVGFARAILHDPEILLLDEPMEGLDPRARIEFRELLVELASRGKAIVVSSHILSELDEIVDRLVVLDQGRLVLSGELEALRLEAGLPGAVRVRLRSDQDPRAAERFLLVRPGIRRTRFEGREAVVELEGGEDAGDALVHDLFAAGIRVESLAPAKPDLESLFLAATRRGE